MAGDPVLAVGSYPWHCSPFNRVRGTVRRVGRVRVHLFSHTSASMGSAAWGWPIVPTHAQGQVQQPCSKHVCLAFRPPHHHPSARLAHGTDRLGLPHLAPRCLLAHAPATVAASWPLLWQPRRMTAFQLTSPPPSHRAPNPTPARGHQTSGPSTASSSSSSGSRRTVPAPPPASSPWTPAAARAPRPRTPPRCSSPARSSPTPAPRRPSWPC